MMSKAMEAGRDPLEIAARGGCRRDAVVNYAPIIVR